MREAGGEKKSGPPLTVRVLEWCALVPRLLFGVMFTMSGISWLRRDDPVRYLTNAVRQSPGLAAPDGIYDAFLAGVVLEHPAVFTGLVATGELLSGVALLLGYPRRAGALGGVFLTVNYGLAAGNPVGGNFVLALLLLLVATKWPYAHLSWKGPFQGTTAADETKALHAG